MTDLDAKALKRYRKALETRLNELEQIQASSADSRAPVTLDQTAQGRLSRMDALQVQAMALETARRRDIGIARVHAAIKRMSEGEFGYCISCGESIEPGRLDNDPATPTCIGCAQDPR